MSTVVSLFHTISAHSSDVNGLIFSRNNLVSCSSDKTVRIWCLEDYSEAASPPLIGHSYPVHGCNLGKGYVPLATCSMDGKAILWDMKTGAKLSTFEHKSKSGIRVVKFSPSGAVLATGSDDETLCLWDIQSQHLISSLGGHDASIVACAFSPDGQFVVTGSTTGDLRIWDAQYGHNKPIFFKLDAHDLGVSCMEFSPSYGSAVDRASATQVHFLLATCGSDNTIKLWDFVSLCESTDAKLQLRDTLTGHTGPVLACSFSPTAHLLASVSNDKTIRLWDSSKGESLFVVEGHARYVTCCAFSLDGCYLATGSNDKQVKIWKITTEQQLNYEVTSEDLLIDFEESSEKGLKSWTVADVCEWLESIDMKQYCEAFKKQAIDGTELKGLDHEILKNAIGIEVFGHRSKILRALNQIQDSSSSTTKKSGKSGGSTVPDEFLCPITREIMKEPVIAADGYTYERSAISSWISSGKTRSPMTNALLANTGLTPNRSLRMLIQRETNT